MNWNDKGYLLIKNKYNENSLISEFFTKHHGKVSGVIFGGTSKKIKNYLTIGNRFHLNYNFKNDGRLGYFKIEIDSVTTPLYLENQLKLSCIVYAMNLIKILTVENLQNINIFKSFDDFFQFLNSKEWLKDFILWELKVFKNLGYDINFNEYVYKKHINGNEKFIAKNNNAEKIIPDFLVNKDLNKKNYIDNNDLILGLKINGDFLDKTILKPNNINFPNSRKHFINLIKL
tara:strand:+ start:22 stop:714 length:693 start_codon:yes stop_codon:yes gene_type:complete